MRMQYDGGSNEGIKDGRRGACDKGCYDEGNESDGEGTFEGPVVGAVGFMGFGEFDWVIDCSVDCLWTEGLECVIEAEKQDSNEGGGGAEGGVKRGRWGGGTRSCWENFSGICDLEENWTCCVNQYYAIDDDE